MQKNIHNILKLNEPDIGYCAINNVWAFISHRDKNIASFVARNIQGNFVLYISVNQGNLAEIFLKIAVYFTFHIFPI